MLSIQWVPVGAGRLALAHRPRLKDVTHLRTLGCQRVVTIQSGSEAALQIGRAVQDAGMAWTWIPVGSGRVPEQEADRLLRGALPELSRQLDAGESILVHCSAGIHRTAMVAYALLRWRGVGWGHALELMTAMRPETRAGLREEHIAWGNRVPREAGR